MEIPHKSSKRLARNRIAIYDLIGGHGGMDYYCLSMAAGLTQVGLEVIYLTNDQSIVFPIKDVRRHDVFDGLWQSKGLYRIYILMYGILKGINYLRKYRVQRIHFHVFRFSFLMLFLIFIHRIFKSIIITVHDVDSFRGGDSKIMRKLIFLLADKIHVHNDFAFNSITKERKFKIPIFQIAHCDYSLFYKKIPVDTLPKNRKIRLLFFGQIKKVKGLDIFLEALSHQKTDKFEIKIRGKLWHEDEDEYDSLFERLKNYSVDCKFEYVVDEQVPTLYRWCDVVILPYRKIYQSGVLLKSLTFGKPVIVSDLQPFLEVVESGYNGLIFGNEDVHSLSYLLETLTHDVITDLALSIRDDNSNLINWVTFGEQLKHIYEA